MAAPRTSTNRRTSTERRHATHRLGETPSRSQRVVAGASCAVEGVRRAVEKVAFTSVRLTTGAVCTPVRGARGLLRGLRGVLRLPVAAAQGAVRAVPKFVITTPRGFKISTPRLGPEGTKSKPRASRQSAASPLAKPFTPRSQGLLSPRPIVITMAGVNRQTSRALAAKREMQHVAWDSSLTSPRAPPSDPPAPKRIVSSSSDAPHTAASLLASRGRPHPSPRSSKSSSPPEAPVGARRGLLSPRSGSTRDASSVSGSTPHQAPRPSVRGTPRSSGYGGKTKSTKSTPAQRELTPAEFDAHVAAADSRNAVSSWR